MLVFLTLLSALLYGLAFMWPTSLALLLVPSLLLLFFLQDRLLGDRSLVHFLGYAFLWGVTAAGIAHYWVYEVICDHSPLPAYYALLGLVFFASMLALTVMVWWGVLFFYSFFFRYLFPTKIFYIFLQRCMIALCCVIYFLSMEYYGGIIAGQAVGYPLFSPTVPLAHYSFFLESIRRLSRWYAPGHATLLTSKTSYPSFMLVKPVINKRNEKSVPHLQSLQGCSQALYQQLLALKPEELPPDKKIIFVSPESTFPYCLNEYDDICRLWGAVLPEKSSWFLGAQYRNERGGRCQAVYTIEQGAIAHCYVKQHLMPLGEARPPSLLARLFGECWFGQREWMDTSCCPQPHMISTDSFIFIPQICSEFFACHDLSYFLPWRLEQENKPALILFFLNDSWFRESFRHLIGLYVARRAAWIGIPVLLIGHDHCVFVSS